MIMIRMLAATCLGLATGQVYAQEVVPIHIIVESGAAQSAPISTVLPERFAIRVVHAQTGVPLANVRLHVGVNRVMCPFSLNCVAPPAGTYGRFDPDIGPAGSPQAHIFTDATGRGAAPPFITGAHPAGYEMYALPSVFIHQPSGMSYSGTYPHHVALFRVNQGSGVPPVAVAVPASGPTGLILLMASVWLAVGARRYLSRRGRTYRTRLWSSMT